jgi:hypothetical protein
MELGERLPNDGSTLRGASSLQSPLDWGAGIVSANAARPMFKAKIVFVLGAGASRLGRYLRAFLKAWVADRSCGKAAIFDAKQT